KGFLRRIWSFGGGGGLTAGGVGLEPAGPWLDDFLPLTETPLLIGFVAGRGLGAKVTGLFPPLTLIFVTLRPVSGDELELLPLVNDEFDPLLVPRNLELLVERSLGIPFANRAPRFGGPALIPPPPTLEFPKLL